MLQSTISYTDDIIASGFEAINATPIAKSSFFNRVADSDPADRALILPDLPYMNQDYIIRNDGADALMIFPQPGGRIGLYDINEAFFIACDSVASFRCISNNTWSVTQSTGRPNLFLGNLTADYVLPLNNINSTITVPAQTGAYTITLQDPTGFSGSGYKFILLEPPGAGNNITFEIPVGVNFTGQIFLPDTNGFMTSTLILPNEFIRLTATAGKGTIIEFEIIDDETYLVTATGTVPGTIVIV